MSYQGISMTRVGSVRKADRCVWCGEAIAVGSPCCRRVYRFNGEFTRDALHPECYAAMGSIDRDELEDGFSPGEWARGRADDFRDLPPEFGPDGGRINPGGEVA